MNDSSDRDNVFVA